MKADATGILVSVLTGVACATLAVLPFGVGAGPAHRRTVAAAFLALAWLFALAYYRTLPVTP